MKKEIPTPSGYYLEKPVQCCLRLLPDPDLTVSAMFERIKVDEKYMKSIVSPIGKDSYKIITKLKSKENDYEYSILYRIKNGEAHCYRIIPAPGEFCGDQVCPY